MGKIIAIYAAHIEVREPDDADPDAVPPLVPLHVASVEAGLVEKFAALIPNGEVSVVVEEVPIDVP